MSKISLNHIFTLLAFFIVHSGFSQNEFRLGLKVGISIPNLKSSGNNPVSKGWSSRQGPYTGIIAEMQIAKRFYLQAELNYSSQGGKKNGVQAIPTSSFSAYFPPNTTIPPYVYADYSSEVKLNYMELPVLLKIEFQVGHKISLFINGGPYAGYLLAAKNITSGSSNIYLDENMTLPLLPQPASFDQSTDIQSDLKKFNFGVQAGIGLSLTLPNGYKLLLTGGGNYGFSDIQKDKTNGQNNTGAATVALAYLVKM